MIGAALLAKKAVEQGPDPQAVGQDHAGARLQGRHRLLRAGRPHPVPGQARLQPRRLRLHHLHRQLRPAAGGGLRGGQRRTTSRVVSVLSGNRNFEGRINPDVKMNYLASPPLVVAYALAGTMDIDLTNEPLGHGHRRQPGLPARHLALAAGGRRTSSTAAIVGGDVHARTTPTCSPATSGGSRCRPRPATRSRGTRDSTYVRKPPYFEGMARDAGPGHRHRRRPGAGQARRLGHHRPHLARPAPSRPTPRPASTSPSTAWSARTSTPTAPAAATTR